MKKVVFIFQILILSLLFINKVDAASFNANIVGEDSFTDEITLYVEVNNIEDLDGDCNGLCGLIASVEYDKEKIELLTIEPLNDFDLTNGKKIVLLKETGVLNNTQLLKLKFKNKTLKPGEDTVVTLSNIIGSDGEQDVSADNVSKTINLRELSKNNNLKKLSLSEGSLKFDSQTLNYNVTVGNNITKITVTALAEDSAATITGLDTYNLKVGTNVISIKVTAEDGSVKTYTLNIKRKNVQVSNKEEVVKSSNNNLKSLVVSNGTLIFNKDVLNYNLTVENEITQIKVNAEVEDKLSTIKGIGNYDLKVGNNAIQITVTAEDESVKVYTLNVKRKEKVIVSEKEEIKEEQNATKPEEKTNDKLIIFGISGFVVLVLAAFIYFKRK